MAIPCALIFPSDYSLGSLIRVRCVECFLEKRRPICAKSARVGCTYNVLQVCGSRATGSLDRDLKTCDDHGEVKATPSACAAGCDLLVICSLNGNPARVGCKSESAKRSLLESGGHVPLPMGDRAATPCDRSLGCEAAPSTYAAGMLCSLRGESAWLECTPAELSAYCLDPMACALQVLPLFFPPLDLLRSGLLVRIHRRVACLCLAEERAINARSIAAVGSCSALLSVWHLQSAKLNLRSALCLSRALLDSSSLPMEDRAATPCDRSLGCEAAPSTYAAGYALLRARDIGLARVRSCSNESTAVWHVFALRKSVLSMPDLLRRLSPAVHCGALGTCGAEQRTAGPASSTTAARRPDSAFDDDCHICKDGGDNVPMCYATLCRRVAHPACVALTRVPSGA